MQPKNIICLWFDKDAEEAARFYAATFPDSEVTAVHKAPADFPGGKEGDVLTVDFTVCGVACLGLNGGPQFKHSEAFSFQIGDGQSGRNGCNLGATGEPVTMRHRWGSEVSNVGPALPI